jgi:hypothetical protein
MPLPAPKRLTLPRRRVASGANAILVDWLARRFRS